MNAELLGELAGDLALFPSSKWEELAEDHVPFEVLTDGASAPEREAIRLVEALDTVAVIGPSGSGKSSLIAGITRDLVGRGFYPLRVGVIAAGRDSLTDAGNFAKHVVREVAKTEAAKTDAWRDMQGAIADERTERTGLKKLGARLTGRVGSPESSVGGEISGELQTAGKEILHRFDPTRAIEALQRLVGVVDFQRRAQPMFILEDTDAWVGEESKRELVDGFFNTGVRLITKELQAAVLVAVHPQYERMDGYSAVHNMLAPVRLPIFDRPRDPLERLLQERMNRRSDVDANVREVFTRDALDLLTDVYSENEGDLRRVLRIAHHALTVEVGADRVSWQAVRTSMKVHAT